MARRSSPRRFLILVFLFSAGVALAWNMWAPPGATLFVEPGTPGHVKPLGPALRELQKKGMPSTAPVRTKPSLGTEHVRDQVTPADKTWKRRTPAGAPNSGWRKSKGWSKAASAPAPQAAQPHDTAAGFGSDPTQLPSVDLTKGEVNKQLEQIRQRLQKTMDQREGVIDQRVQRNLRGRQ